MPSTTNSLQKFAFLVFFIIFVLGGVPLIFYANGWRFNTATRQVERVASLGLRVEPDDAEIWIDGVQHPRGKNVHGYQIWSSINPGRHAIEVKKPGHTSWQHELVFKPGETTFLNHVQLFPEVAAVAIPVPDASLLTLISAPDNPLPFVITQATNTVLQRIERRPTPHLIPVTKFAAPIQLAETQPNRWLFRNNSDSGHYQWFLFDETAITPLYTLFPFLFSKITFDPNDRNSLFALDGNRLLSLKQKQKTVRQIIKLSTAETIVDIIPQKNHLYVLANTSQHTLLITYRIEADNQYTEFSRLPLPLMKQASARPSPAELITIFDQTSGLLALVTLERAIPTSTSIIYEVTGTESNPESGSLLWWKHDALWLTQTQHMQHTSLATFTQPIMAVQKDPQTSTRYVLSPARVTSFDFVDETTIHQTALIETEGLIQLALAADRKSMLLVQTDQAAPDATRLLFKTLQ